MNDMNDANDERVGEIEGGARGVDDDPLDRSEAPRRGTVRLEEEAHGNDDDEDDENENVYETPRAGRGGAGEFPFGGAGGWTPTGSEDSSTPGSPGFIALHAFVEEVFTLWPQLLADDESRKASFRALGKFFDDFFRSEERARYNLTAENVFTKQKYGFIYGSNVRSLHDKPRRRRRRR